MRLREIDSSQLLPEFAAAQRYACAALDEYIKTVEARRPALSGGFTMAAIEAMTDEELQAAYKDLDLAEYYPDLSRATRNRMLWLEFRVIERLGTPAAVEAMTQYVMGQETPTHLRIIDNLAFDENGALIDQTLLHYFDAVIVLEDAQRATFSEFYNERIRENIRRFGRVSKVLRSIAFEFAPAIADVNVSPHADADIIVTPAKAQPSPGPGPGPGPEPPEPMIVGWANLMGEWDYADPMDPEYDEPAISAAGAGYTVVKSVSAYHTSNGSSTMDITFSIPETMTIPLKIMSRGETNYDFVYINLDGSEFVQFKTAEDVWNDVPLELTPGTHTVEIIYKKDGSVDNEPDCGYAALPNDYITIQ